MIFFRETCGTSNVTISCIINRLSQKRPLQEDRRRVVSDFVNNEIPGAKRRWQASNGEPKTVFSRLSARVPSTADDSADEDDTAIKVIFLFYGIIFFFFLVLYKTIKSLRLLIRSPLCLQE